MSSTKREVRVGAYYDSVVLMQLQKSLCELPDVVDAGAVMATQANRDLLIASGYDLAGVDANADDLLILVRANSEQAAAEAIEQVDELIRARRSSASQDFRPHSLRGAVDAYPTAKWVLVSVPGRYAAGVCEEALDLDRHVFLYSDNVALADEVRLKQKAQEKGLLVMGPDCGTAVINGVGLGFANRVRKGQIGLVAASGTGLQAVASGIHNLGQGISQAIGTGGRDLKSEVGAVTAKQALDLLGRDAQTHVVVLISKPPDAQVASELLRMALATGKPTVVCFLGLAIAGRQLGNLYFAAGLQEAASYAVNLATNGEQQAKSLGQRHAATQASFLRALFSGGTLAYEALLGLQSILSPLYSNIPVREEQRLPDSMVSQSHTILDLGEDEFTQGRLHPMMDNDLRIRRLRQEAADPKVAMIMFDVVLGEGAHPDPASELAPAIADVQEQRPIEMVAIVLGTDEDPQDIDRQTSMLEQVGVKVFRETEDAVSYVGSRLSTAPNTAFVPLPLDDFAGEFVGINVGVESFYESLLGQGARAVHVDWRPPAGGNEKLMAILAKMRSK